MKIVGARFIVFAVSAFLLLLLPGSSLRAAIISNPGFLFTAGGGHTDGDSGGHAVNMNNTNTPSWKPSSLVSGFSAIATDPQPIFNNPNEYLQVQTNVSGSTQDAYQQVTIPTPGSYTLTMDADRRNDNVNFNGSMILELWSGSLTVFNVGSAITPSSFSSPVLTTTFQQFSRTYNSLAAGSYTVRVGGLHAGGSDFQAGIDNVDISLVPEPSGLVFAAGGLGGVLLAARRKERVQRSRLK